MKVIAKTNGEASEHEIPEGVQVVLSDPSIKLDAPEAGRTITPKTTIKCIESMSQQAWTHISTGPLFQYFFNILYEGESVVLPEDVSTLLEDFPESVVHACGLIVELVEAKFEKVPDIFLKNPEDGFHPRQIARLMTMINAIQSMDVDSAEVQASVE